MVKAPTGTSPRSNARGISTRSRLLDAALGAFATNGFHGTSTRDIAEAAGMSPAGVYAHFATKEEVLFRLSLAGHTEARDLVLAAASRSAEPAAQLREVVADFAAWHARFHTLARVVQYEMAALSPAHTEEIAALRTETQAKVRGILADGVRGGVFSLDDPRTVARALVSLGIDVARWYDPAGPLTPEAIGSEYAELALRLAGGR